MATRPEDRYRDAATLARAASAALSPRRPKPAPARVPKPVATRPPRPAPVTASTPAPLAPPAWAIVPRSRWKSGQIPLVLQMTLLVLGVAAGAAVIFVPGTLRLVAAAVAAFAVSARLLLQALMHLEGAWLVSAAPDDALRVATDAVTRVPGWRLLRSGPGAAEFQEPRRVQPLIAVAMALLLVAPAVAYVVYQRRWPRLHMRVASTADGTVLRLDAFGSEATRRAADVQRALGLIQ